MTTTVLRTPYWIQGVELFTGSQGSRLHSSDLQTCFHPITIICLALWLLNTIWAPRPSLWSDRPRSQPSQKVSPDLAFKYGRPLVPAYNLTLFSNRQENREVVSKDNGCIFCSLRPTSSISPLRGHSLYGSAQACWRNWPRRRLPTRI